LAIHETKVFLARTRRKIRLFRTNWHPLSFDYSF